MGKTCEPKAFSFQCMTKFTTKKKKNPGEGEEGLYKEGVHGRLSESDKDLLLD